MPLSRIQRSHNYVRDCPAAQLRIVGIFLCRRDGDAKDTQFRPDRRFDVLDRRVRAARR